MADVHAWGVGDLKTIIGSLGSVTMYCHGVSASNFETVPG